MNQKTEKENPMEKIRIEKVVLSVGGTGEQLEKGFKLLKFLTKKTPEKTKSKKRIPDLGIRPGLEIGAVVTIRKESEDILRKMLSTIDNVIKKKQVSENTFSFGIKEYIEIPGIEYQREIGILGFDVTIVFKRPGKRTGLKKRKKGRLPRRHHVSKEEIIKFMEENFDTEFV